MRIFTCGRGNKEIRPYFSFVSYGKIARKKLMKRAAIHAPVQTQKEEIKDHAKTRYQCELCDRTGSEHINADYQTVMEKEQYTFPKPARNYTRNYGILLRNTLTLATTKTRK